MLEAMSLPYEETQLLPLTTDQDVERRVADLIGRANSRQLWLLFLDEFDIQLPLLIPIEGLPFEPTDDQAFELSRTLYPTGIQKKDFISEIFG